MAQQAPSTKRRLIDQANNTVVGVTAAACFIVVFSLVAAHALISQLGYQNRIIRADKKTLAVLKTNINTVSKLDDAYQAFVSTPQNVLGGNPSGNGGQDGDNAKITLDALPSQYDFPALATSLQAILNSQGVQIQSISGIDDEVAQDTGKASGNPSPVVMPFQITVTGSYQAIQNAIQAFDHSIRPIQVQMITIAGNQSNLTLNLTAQTFYQQQKSLNISSEVVK